MVVLSFLVFTSFRFMFLWQIYSLWASSFTSTVWASHSYSLYVCVPACLDVHHMCDGAHKAQKMTWDLQELELQVGMSCLLWVLGTRARTSVGVASALTHCGISPAPEHGYRRLLKPTNHCHFHSNSWLMHATNYGTKYCFNCFCSSTNRFFAWYNSVHSTCTT